MDRPSRRRSPEVALTAALLAGLAVLLLAWRPRADRLAALRAPIRRPTRLGLSAASVKIGFALGGLGVWAVGGGAVGLVAGLLIAAVGPQVLSRIEGPPDEDALVARDLPLALDLLAACLSGGAVAVDAARAVAAAVPGPCGRRLATVAARLDVGSSAADAWRSLGEDRGPAGAAARALSRSASGGAPVAAAVLQVAADVRRVCAARAEQAARRAGVLAVGPLGLCFLPAFLLLGVVPAVVGLAAPLLKSL